METRDLYNIYKQKTQETVVKGEKVPENRYTLSVMVLIQNLENKILVQKRSVEKGGKYGLTAGHPKSGESSIQGIVSEIKEELGIEVNPKELKLKYSERNDNKRKFYDLYYIKKDFDIDKMTLQKEEVEYVQWCTEEEIDKLCSEGSFKKSHIDAFEVLKTKIRE